MTPEDKINKIYELLTDVENGIGVRLKAIETTLKYLPCPSQAEKVKDLEIQVANINSDINKAKGIGYISSVVAIAAAIKSFWSGH